MPDFMQAVKGQVRLSFLCDLHVWESDFACRQSILSLCISFELCHYMMKLVCIASIKDAKLLEMNKI